MIRTLLRFAAYAAVGFFLQVLPIVDREFVAPFIRGMTAISGALIDTFGGSVIVAQDILRSPVNGFAVQVDNGCSGLEAVILCIAAILAFPANWRLRLAGAICCTAAILGLNVIRIISLFYLGQFSMQWFEWAHLYAWDVLIMVDGVVALILWVRFVTRREAANPASAASAT